MSHARSMPMSIADLANLAYLDNLDNLEKRESAGCWDTRILCASAAGAE
jgi:hypothetical protein